jgi:NADH:ubiquinone oxidoreductase subunit 6 (subunit J)
MLITRDVLKAALFLLVTLLSVAALYVLMTAELLAVAQILVYAAGLVIVIIFGIMLTSKMSGAPLKVLNGNGWAGSAVGVLLLALLMNNIPSTVSTLPNRQTYPDRVTETGKLLMTTYVLPFELAGILLLVALIGAAVVSTSGLLKKKS